MSVYKGVIQNLLSLCEDYRQQKLNLEDLEGVVCNSAHQIVLVEEKGLRSFLFNKEWELEKLRFTCDENKTFDETLKIIEQIEARALQEL